MGTIARVTIDYRAATAADRAVLWSMLFHAAHAAEDGRDRVEDVQRDPALARYVDGWPRVGDLGVVARRDGAPIGAAWLRLLVGDEQRSSAFVDERTPEIAVAVPPGTEGRGVGTRMLTELLARADAQYGQTTLNARADNPAVRLYERLGFVAVGVIVNRVGSESVKMIRLRP